MFKRKASRRRGSLDYAYFSISECGTTASGRRGTSVDDEQMQDSTPHSRSGYDDNGALEYEEGCRAVRNSDGGNGEDSSSTTTHDEDADSLSTAEEDGSRIRWNMRSQPASDAAGTLSGTVQSLRSAPQQSPGNTGGGGGSQKVLRRRNQRESRRPVPSKGGRGRNQSWHLSPDANGCAVVHPGGCVHCGGGGGGGDDEAELRDAGDLADDFCNAVPPGPVIFSLCGIIATLWFL